MNLTDDNLEINCNIVSNNTNIKDNPEKKHTSLSNKIREKEANKNIKPNLDFDSYSKKKTQNTIKTKSLINQVFKENVKFLNSKISGLNYKNSNSTNKSNSTNIINSIDEKVNRSINIKSNINK